MKLTTFVMIGALTTMGLATVAVPSAAAQAGCVIGNLVCTCVAGIPAGNTCTDTLSGNSCVASTGPNQQTQIGIVCA